MMQRANTVSNELGALGIKMKLLTTQEIIELLYSSYNLQQAETEKLVGISDLSARLVQSKSSQEERQKQKEDTSDK